jgi:hypothetical protein
MQSAHSNPVLSMQQPVTAQIGSLPVQIAHGPLRLQKTLYPVRPCRQYSWPGAWQLPVHACSVWSLFVPLLTPLNQHFILLSTPA